VVCVVMIQARGSSVRKQLSYWSSGCRMLRVAGRTVELGMTLLHCFATPFGVGNTVLLSNVITLLL
jgi:hypothetical protein